MTRREHSSHCHESNKENYDPVKKKYSGECTEQNHRNQKDKLQSASTSRQPLTEIYVNTRSDEEYEIIERKATSGTQKKARRKDGRKSSKKVEKTPKTSRKDRANDQENQHVTSTEAVKTNIRRIRR
ncbi:9065_t:CDS:2 [Paraglomus brasilianum]|uniref:9065_t:CDS:1 n=1 Tax=Paraglomus brasilianum TaxID=144538 RepID=A0A9N9G2X3_9GLOM|nr:9065_t:CDS:2 [Paraglomus brasilianum]